MRNRSRLIIVGTVTLLIGVIVLFPARVAYHWFAPDEVRMSGIDGSLWRGNATEALAVGIYARNLRWSFRPLQLFTGKLGLHAEFDVAGGFLEADVAAGLGGTITLNNLEGAVRIGALQSIFPTPGIEGNVRFDFDEVTIEDRLPVAADGSIEVVSLLVRGLSTSPIGDYRAQFSTSAEGIIASIEDLAGILDVAGSLRVAPDRTYALTGLVAPTPTTPTSVVEQMRFLGSPNERGQRQFRFEGSL